MKELLRTHIQIISKLIPSICRFFGVIVILNGVVFLGIAVLVYVKQQEPTSVYTFILMGLGALLAIAMGVVIFKWFARFMVWNLKRCAKAFGLEQEDN